MATTQNFSNTSPRHQYQQLNQGTAIQLLSPSTLQQANFHSNPIEVAKQNTPVETNLTDVAKQNKPVETNLTEVAQRNRPVETKLTEVAKQNRPVETNLTEAAKQNRPVETNLTGPAFAARYQPVAIFLFHDAELCKLVGP